MEWDEEGWWDGTGLVCDDVLCGVERICVASTSMQMQTESSLYLKLRNIYKVYSQEKKITYIWCFTRTHVSGE